MIPVFIGIATQNIAMPYVQEGRGPDHQRCLGVEVLLVSRYFSPRGISETLSPLVPPSGTYIPNETEYPRAIMSPVQVLFIEHSFSW